jgi:hypothetical protein
MRLSAKHCYKIDTLCFVLMHFLDPALPSALSLQQLRVHTHRWLVSQLADRCEQSWNVELLAT